MMKNPSTLNRNSREHATSSVHTATRVLILQRKIKQILHVLQEIWAHDSIIITQEQRKQVLHILQEKWSHN